MWLGQGSLTQLTSKLEEKRRENVTLDYAPSYSRQLAIEKIFSISPDYKKPQDR